MELKITRKTVGLSYSTRSSRRDANRLEIYQVRDQRASTHRRASLSLQRGFRWRISSSQEELSNQTKTGFRRSLAAQSILRNPRSQISGKYVHVEIQPYAWLENLSR